VRLFEGGEEVFEREVEGRHPIRIGADFERLVEPSLRVDFGDPLAAQLRGDFPVENRAELHGGVPFAAHFELQDLSQRSGHRAHLGVAVSGRDFVLGANQPLGDEVSRPVDVGAIFKDDRDDRQAELRRAAQLVEPWETGHGPFDGIGDVPLDFEGREGPRGGDDGDLGIGHVGDRVNRQVPGRIKTCRRDEAGEDQHQEAIFD
jgi:hypothetical protein